MWDLRQVPQAGHEDFWLNPLTTYSHGDNNICGLWCVLVATLILATTTCEHNMNISYRWRLVSCTTGATQASLSPWGQKMCSSSGS